MAVFLSYASQDIEAAQRICEALREAGIEVWFDRNELRGGDNWDRKIRQQIHDCALFVPLISANTDARHEGYFRREWRLAVERAGDMSDRKAFLVPVVVDDILEAKADVPDRFRAVHWTHVPGGSAPGPLVDLVSRLLAGEPAATGDNAANAPGAVVPVRSGAWRNLALVSALVCLAVLGYLGFEKFERSRALRAAAASIAVLPLTNESGESSDQYFSDGISEDLITALSKIPGLKVIGRTSAFQFRNTTEDSRSIGAKLGVRHLLEGSVRRFGGTVRVSAELIDAADGTTQWSERYDRPYGDLFALQDEITHTVAVALRTKLVSADAAALGERPPNGSVDAYNALLQGRFFYQRHSEEGWKKALEWYTQAIRLEPRYALAWAELCRTYIAYSGSSLEGEAAQEANKRAREASDRALELAPELAAAHTARGFLLQNVDFDWGGAAREFQRAIELAPSEGDPKFFLAIQRTTLGQVDSAIDFTRQALSLDPLRANLYRWLAICFLGVNRLPDAETAIRRALELQPAAVGYHQTLALVELLRGNVTEALAAAQQETPGIWRDSALALVQQKGTDRGVADAALKDLIDRDGKSAAYQVAQVYALRGDANGVFEWLDRAWATRDPGITFLLSDSLMQRYRADPRFAAFCRKVSLPVPG